MGYFTKMCLVVARVFGSFVEVVNRAKISEAPAIGKKKMGESLFFSATPLFNIKTNDYMSFVGSSDIHLYL